ncbi:hypothetical protein Ciccas_005551 [Cichlidogyrus casuarinus]|uniref:Uncharacterized protein n=1 Tax=Cichlidogyrus casuarinus TaxID=1844966 RepID=A0ABD2Q8E0_9PLAT
MNLERVCWIRAPSAQEEDSYANGETSIKLTLTKDPKQPIPPSLTESSVEQLRKILPKPSNSRTAFTACSGVNSIQFNNLIYQTQTDAGMSLLAPGNEVTVKVIAPEETPSYTELKTVPPKVTQNSYAFEPVTPAPFTNYNREGHEHETTWYNIQDKSEQAPLWHVS